ncbi:MAG: hypothetical protein OHK0028_07970 [Deltaproteobacteria bacterium]
MKRLVTGLLAGFALLLSATIFLAYRSFEGLVDRRYTEAANEEFPEREAEAREGFTISLPETYREGVNRFQAVLSTSSGPLRNARVTLEAIRVEGTGSDRSWVLREISPGRYAADVHLPLPGRWLFSLAAEAGRLHPRRRWTAVAQPSGDGGTLRGAAGAQEVLLTVAPWPAPSMRDVEFTVVLPRYTGAAAPWIDLSMPGMEMGRNRVDLTRGADGVYRGSGVFVRCASGRHDWEAAVTVPGAGKAVFRFAVAD